MVSRMLQFVGRNVALCVGKVWRSAGRGGAVASGCIVGLPIVGDAGRQKLSRSVLGFATLLAVGVVMALGAACTKEESTPAEVQTKKGHSEDVSIDWESITPAELEGRIVRGELDPNVLIKGKDLTYSLIMQAAKYSGNPDVLDVLVKHGADINWSESKSGFTALHFTAYQGILPNMKRLLELGADIHQEDKITEGPLIFFPVRSPFYNDSALRKRAIEILLAHGANLQATHYENNSLVINLLMAAMLKSARSSEPESYDGMLSYLVSLGMDVNNNPKGNAFPPIHLALFQGLNSSVINELVMLSGDINLSNAKGITPVMVFAMGGNDITVFDTLLTLGADIDAQTLDGLSVLTYIDNRKNGDFDSAYTDRTNKKYATIEEWREFGDKILFRIEVLCRQQSYQICRDLDESLGSEPHFWQISPSELEGLIVRDDFDPNQIIKSEGGASSPLIQVVLEGKNPDLLDVLVKHGGDLSWREPRLGLTALHRAARSGKIKMLERLLSLGADINQRAKTPDYELPIIFEPLWGSAIETAEERKQVIAILLAHGAKIDDIANIDGEPQNLLQVALIAMFVGARPESYEGILSYLVSLGLKVNDAPVGNKGNHVPPIHYWAMGGKDDGVMKELIELGGDVNFVNADGVSPLLFSVFGRDINMFNTLIELGADIDFQDEDGASVIDYANERKNGAADFMYAKFKEAPVFAGDFPTVEKWRAFGDKVIERVEFLCEQEQHRVCEELE